MRAEIRAVRLHDHGAGRQRARGTLELRARGGREVRPGHEAPGSPARGGRQRPRRQRRAEERPRDLPAAARDHDLAVRRAGGRRGIGAEVARVDQAVTQPVGEGVRPLERDDVAGSRGRGRGRSTAARPRWRRARTTPGSACSRARPGGSPRREARRRPCGAGPRPPRREAAPARTRARAGRTGTARAAPRSGRRHGDTRGAGPAARRGRRGVGGWPSGRAIALAASSAATRGGSGTTSAPPRSRSGTGRPPWTKTTGSPARRSARARRAARSRWPSPRRCWQ